MASDDDGGVAVAAIEVVSGSDLDIIEIMEELGGK